MSIQTFEKTRHNQTHQREAEEVRSHEEDAEMDTRLAEQLQRHHELDQSYDEVIHDIDFALAGLKAIA